MKKKIIGISLLTFVLVANLQLAFLDYGLGSNNLGNQLIAQTNTGGSSNGDSSNGDSSDGGSTDGGNTGDPGDGGDSSGGDTSGNPYSKNYLNNPQPCQGTETRHCSIIVGIPGTGYNCDIGFDYTVQFNGTQNYCVYTGNKLNSCSFHVCKRN